MDICKSWVCTSLGLELTNGRVEDWNNGRLEKSEEQPSILPPFVMSYLSEVHTQLL